MGRPRKSRRNIPPYVYLGKGRWYLRPYLGNGKFGPEVRLCGPEASDRKIWDAYLESVETGQPKGSLNWLIEKYFDSNDFGSKAVSTQKEYKHCGKTIQNTRTKDGRKFGDRSIARITPGVLRKYADKRAETSVVRANRELAFLSIVFSYGFERDYVNTNPAKGVKKTAEPPRQRYVTDDEYAAVYEQAPATLQIAMEFAFLCRLRRGEVLALQRQHVLDGGLHVIRSKGSKDQIIEWTPRLRKVVKRAQKLPGQIASTYLIHNKYGQRVRNEAFKSAWQRTIAKAVKKSAIERFTFHDLKRKAVSDFSGDKLLASGHHSASMLRIYDVSIGTVPATK